MMKYFIFLRTAFRGSILNSVPQNEGIDVFGSSAINPIAVWSEKVSGCGEDAEPTIVVSADGKFGLVAVFDGLGGSGAGKYETTGGTVTGARLAASVARRALIATVRQIWLRARHRNIHHSYHVDKNEDDRAQEARFGVYSGDASWLVTEAANRIEELEQERREAMLGSVGTHSDDEYFDILSTLPNPSLDDFDGETFSRCFDTAFSEVMTTIGPQTSNSRLKSRVRRYLPTTFAGAIFEEGDQSASLKVFWAGDSRIYYLCNRGLFQLSIDHAKPNFTGGLDPNGDAPLTRMISELGPNEIESYAISELREPGYLIACTDGAYAYFPTAVHFELALWSALKETSHHKRLEVLTAEIAAVAQDDASIAVVPVGHFGTELNLEGERRGELIAKRDQFEEGIDTLRSLKLRVASLDARIEEMRENMRARDRSLLNTVGRP